MASLAGAGARLQMQNSGRALPLDSRQRAMQTCWTRLRLLADIVEVLMVGGIVQRVACAMCSVVPGA